MRQVNTKKIIPNNKKIRQYRWSDSDEELGSVRVGAGISHAHGVGPVVA